MNVRVRVTRDDVTTETEVDTVELWQLPHVMMIARDGWMPSQQDIETMRKLGS